MGGLEFEGPGPALADPLLSRPSPLSRRETPRFHSWSAQPGPPSVAQKRFFDVRLSSDAR